ncbi:glycosyltransferase family 2 protein [Roseinatronobacter alkalisoli]|uniref:Glycosyltransferase family 2 protein n=1 Tax=Roseinatronobacter alkalisoli TaxID=3028235 RepID=A0ABT5TA36_9RHOB|nr:glycosyltransferase family 2 protein [Roseinatronobacter sp. HJB301]MDD7971984.1 glycosyltransferase family 2 protein [Roseinatronobacter sp. HJB301]
MKISVIMAAYNSQATIGRAIESFLAQAHPDKELIVIDGASKDNTCAIVENFNSPLIRLHSEHDNGIYDAMNKGLRRISGDAFGCLNSDDCYARPDALALIADALKDADIVSGRLHFVREHDGSAPVRRWHPELHRPGAYARGFSLPHPTSYARRTVLERVGEFSTQYRSASDYDWLMRALEIEGFSHAIIDEVLVNMRIGGESTAGLRAIWKNSRELLEVRQKRLGSGVLDIAMVLNLYRKFMQRAGH